MKKIRTNKTATLLSVCRALDKSTEYFTKWSNPLLKIGVLDMNDTGGEAQVPKIWIVLSSNFPCHFSQVHSHSNLQ